MDYSRPQAHTLRLRLASRGRSIQIVSGPRHVGKTTLVRQVTETMDLPAWSATADRPTLRDRCWIAEQWEHARIRAGDGPGLLVLDEVQMAQGWVDSVRTLWDEDTACGCELKVVLVGSAPWLIEPELTQTIAGHCEILRLGHWSYTEMRDAFEWSLDQYMYFGGYPGATALVEEERQWARYIVDRLIETTIARDVLLHTRVEKPVLLRRLFDLCCRDSGRVVSYNRMLGQLHDAGNTTTLAHYLELLEASGLVRGLPKYAGQVVRRRGSSPKLQVLNTALISARLDLGFESVRMDRARWGQLVRAAVGAHLANAAAVGAIQLRYWRDRNDEIDFVVSAGSRLFGIVVKSVRGLNSPRARNRFTDAFNPERVLVVGPTGVPLERFLSHNLEAWVG